MGRAFVRLHIKPDAISYTGLALLTGVVVWFVSHPHRAFLFILLYVVFDGIDGAYARYLNRPTQAGAFTDVVVDQLGMIVIMLGFIHYDMVDGQIGAYYIVVYVVMIAFSVIQNAQGIPMQYIFRSKYIVYGMYMVWAFTGLNLAPFLIPIFCAVMTFSAVQSFLRLKRGFNWKYDLPKIMEQERTIRREGGKPPEFWRPLNFFIPASVVAVLLFLGAYTQIVAMVEFPDVKPKWEKSSDLYFLKENENPWAVAGYKDGWLVSAFDRELSFATIYHVRGPMQRLRLEGSFRIPFAMHRQHGAATLGDMLYITDRLSRSVFEIDVAHSLERKIAAINRSFDATLDAPVACEFVELNGTRRMLISEYMHLYKTIVVDYEKAFAKGDASDAVVAWYRNAGFSRGLATDGKRLFEINGSLGDDLIYVIDPERALGGKYIRAGIDEKIAAPRWRTRDIAIRGDVIAMVDGRSDVIWATSLEKALER